MENKLGKLKKIDLRKAWNHEAFDFTNWLAEEDNMQLLSDEIGIDLDLIETEASVGKFSVDILAEEENTGRKVIIENQLEATNHDHLGKIITYASGFDAEIIIWIVKEVRDEHKKAIDWLNEHSDKEISFFAIKMELWQIGNSPFAPKFMIICQPNDWAKAIKSSGQLSETKIMQMEFWNNFKEYASEGKTKLSLTKAMPQHWYNISCGSSEVHIALTINSPKNQIACELYISDSKETFFGLKKYKRQIEQELGRQLKWMELEGAKASRIKLEKDADFFNKDNWDNYFKWLKEYAEKFHRVFPKYVKKVKQ